MIKIAIIGEEFHAKKFYDLLKKYEKTFDPLYIKSIEEIKNDSDVDLIHIISSPLPILLKTKILNKPAIYHWIGTDVYRFVNDSLLKKISKKFILKSSGVKNFVVSDNLKDELNRLGIASTILPLVYFGFIDNIPPLPEKFSVLSYVPEKRWDYYYGNTILELAEKLPDIDFHLVASGKKEINLNNVFTYGFIEDLFPFYKNCSALLRLTVHDGLPKMVLEALSYGRHVLWNGTLPNCFKTTKIEECINVLNKLKQNPETNYLGKEYVEKNFNPDIIIEDYLNLCEKLLVNR